MCGCVGVCVCGCVCGSVCVGVCFPLPTSSTPFPLLLLVFPSLSHFSSDSIAFHTGKKKYIAPPSLQIKVCGAVPYLSSSCFAEHTAGGANSKSMSIAT